MPWRNLVNDQDPEVMEQIHRDLALGYEVLEIPQSNYKINLYDHGYYTIRCGSSDMARFTTMIVAWISI